MSKHKTIQLKTTIGRADLERKMKQAQGFLEKGQSVRITLLLFGRQKGRPELGVVFLEDIYKEFLYNFKVSSKPTIKNLTLHFNAPPKS